MVLDIFGKTVELIQSTSPVAGKLCASMRKPDGTIEPDMFLWDPLSSTVDFVEERLTACLLEAKKAQNPGAAAVLGVTDGVITAVRWLRGLFGGSYGGSLGFGGLGAMVAILSLVLFVAVSLAAAAIVIPLSIAAWLMRSSLKAGIEREKARVLDQVVQYFQALQSPQARAAGA